MLTGLSKTKKMAIKEANKIRIKDLPLAERPRERLIRSGPVALSNSELLAIIMRTGTQKENVLDLANRLLKEHDLKSLSQVNVTELRKILGIGETKACQIVACFELSKRLGAYYGELKPHIKTSEDVVNLFMDRFRNLDKECFSVVLLNSKNKLINYQTVSLGDLNETIAHPREIFQTAIKNSASRMIVVHNHPSGDPTPSESDMQLTEKLIEAGNLLGITVLDHVIIGDGKWWSWREGK